MPENAPSGNPMAISLKVTHVCWSKSPDWKLLIIEEMIRLGLLIRKGSIHRPEAISHSKRNAATMNARRMATHKLRFPKTPPAVAAVELKDLACVFSGAISLDIGIAS